MLKPYRTNKNGLDSANYQKRASRRLKCFVRVTIDNLTRKKQMLAKCVNISFGGMGLEIPRGENQFIFSGDNLHIKLHLADELNCITRLGRMIWSDKDIYGNLHTGIKFIPEIRRDRGDIHALTI